MAEIKVLQVGLSPNRGGIETMVHSWWMNLDQRIIQFDFLNVYEEPIAFEEEFMSGGSRIIKIVSRRKNFRRHSYELKKIFCEGHYDYIHCHIMSLSEPEPVNIANHLKECSAKVIMHSHTVISRNAMDWKRRLIHWYGRVKLKYADYFCLACGTEAGASMFYGKQFTVIENGIDLGMYKFSYQYRQKIREDYGIDKATFVIGHVGRAGIPKNYPFLIRTFAEAVRRYPDSKLMLIGDVDNDKDVQGQINQYDVTDRVICTGKIQDVFKFYSAMDVFFLPSLYEGLSVSLVEAQASGLPCVVSEFVARESAVSDYVEFLPIDNAENMANALLKHYDNDLSQRGTRKVQDAYDIKRSVAKLLEFYKDNLSR